MNNQVKLIDAQEALEAVEGLYQIIQRGDLTTSDLEEAERAYERFMKVCIKSPVPTIKPGDKVYHKKLKANGEVRDIYINVNKAIVNWIDGAPNSYVNFVDLEDLEVIENE